MGSDHMLSYMIQHDGGLHAFIALPGTSSMYVCILSCAMTDSL